MRKSTSQQRVHRRVAEKHDLQPRRSRTPTLTAFASSPDGGRAWRATCVPGRLKAGRPYDILGFSELKAPGYLSRQPFGQIPVYEDDGLVLFESGAIVLHLAGRYPGLLPDDADARARAVAWLFAALNTVEPPIVEREQVSYTEADQPWYSQRLPLLESAPSTRPSWPTTWATPTGSMARSVPAT